MLLDWQVYSALTLDEVEYSAYTSDFGTTGRVIFRETLCDDPIPSSPSTIAVIAISLVIITIIVAIVGILFCKFKKKACFNLDRKVVDSKKKKDKKDLVIVSIANGAESLP